MQLVGEGRNGGQCVAFSTASPAVRSAGLANSQPGVGFALAKRAQPEGPWRVMSWPDVILQEARAGCHRCLALELHQVDNIDAITGNRFSKL